MLKKKGIKTVLIFSIIILFFGLIYLGFLAYFRLPVSSYYKASKKAFVIPGLNSNFVPQGLCFDDETNFFLVSGYDSKNAPSSIYLVNKSTNKTEKKVELYLNEQTAFIGHAGGVAVNNDFVYVMDDTGIVVFSYSQLKSAENNGKIYSLGRVSTVVSENNFLRVDFLSVIGDKLYVGEFYKEGKYETAINHKIITNDGKNYAFILEYDLSDDTFGFNEKPNKIFSIPDQVQGMTIYQGKLFLSCSYGLGFSSIKVYDLDSTNNLGEASVLNSIVPIYVFDSQNLIKTIKAPPMSEEIVIIDNELYVMNESACSKYIFGKFTGGRWCYKTDLSKVLD